MEKERIKYRHVDDKNTWYVQSKTDELPVWAVDVQDFEKEVDKGHRCDQCRYAKLKDYGYSAWTVEGTSFSCVRELHPDGTFDRFYGEDGRLKYANKCDWFRHGDPIHIRLE